MACLGISGCVWLRLLDTRDQLCNIPRKITVNYDEGNRPKEVIFEEPTLLPKDIVDLAGANPVYIKPKTSEGIKTYIYKAFPYLHTDDAHHIIELKLDFNDPHKKESYKLSKVVIPYQFQEVLRYRKHVVDQAIELACAVDLGNLGYTSKEFKLDIKDVDPRNLPTKNEIEKYFGTSTDNPKIKNGLSYEYCIETCIDNLNDRTRIAEVKITFLESKYIDELRATYFNYYLEMDFTRNKASVRYTGGYTDRLFMFGL